MNTEKRVRAYQKQNGSKVLTAKQRRRVKQKGRRRHETGELS